MRPGEQHLKPKCAKCERSPKNFHNDATLILCRTGPRTGAIREQAASKARYKVAAPMEVEARENLPLLQLLNSINITRGGLHSMLPVYQEQEEIKF